MDGKIMVSAAAVLGLASKLALAQTPTPVPSETAPEAPSQPAPSAQPSEGSVPSEDATPGSAPEPEAEPQAEPKPEPRRSAPRGRVRWRSNAEEPPAEDEAEETRADGAVAEPQPAAAMVGWQLGGAHFVLSFERLTTLLSWKQTTTVETTQQSSFGSPMTTTSEQTISGTDVSLLVAGQGRTASAVPRIAFDGIFDGGFSVGGSLGYQSSAGKQQASPESAEVNLATTSVFVFGARLGYFLPTSERVGLWLRGGFTHTAVGAEGTTTDTSGVSVSTSNTLTAWDFSLDPQLVLVAAPRVAITLGPLLDIPLSGSDKVESGGKSAEIDYSTAAYGATAGASAIF